jgi:hypothetical protein
MLVCIAGPLNTGQQFMTYLFVQFLPITILILCFLTYPTNNLATTISKTAPWHLWGNSRIVQRKRVKKYKKPVRELQNKAKSQMLQTYLFPAIFLPSRLAVALRFFSNVSQVPPSGTLPTWFFNVKQRFNQLHRQSDSILTPTLLG